MSLLNRDTAVLLALVLLGALLAVLHVATWLRILHSQNFAWQLRWLGWLPPLTPVLAFVCGSRWLAALWCVVATAYVVLRTLP